MADEKKPLPILVSVSTPIELFTKQTSGKDLESRSDSTVDGLIPESLRDATIETVIEDVLKSATDEEKETADLIRKAMDETARQNMHSQHICYFVNDMPVDKTNPISRYLKESTVPVAGKDYPVRIAEIRIDKAYWI